MTGDEDWLGEPEQHPVLKALYDDVTPADFRKVDIVPEQLPAEQRKTLRALRRIRPVERAWIRAYLACNCNAQAASRSLKARQGWSLSPPRAYRLMRHDDDFRTALQGLQSDLMGLAGIDPVGILLRTNAVVEDAMTPAPILHQGEDTGYREVDRANALRGLEAMAKWQGMGAEKVSARVVVNVVRLDGPAKVEAEVIEAVVE